MAKTQMTDEQFRKRREELQEQEQDQPFRWWYVSFAGDDGWRGAVIVEARGIDSALWEVNRRKLNPHGEVLARAIPEERIPDEQWRYRLLNKADVQAMWPDDEVKSIAELEAEV